MTGKIMKVAFAVVILVWIGNVAYGETGCTVKLESSDGSTEFVVQDSTAAAQFTVDSDGNMQCVGKLDLNTGDYNVFIADNSEGLSHKWDGGIDEVIVYDRALSDLEVMYLAH